MYKNHTNMDNGTKFTPDQRIVEDIQRIRTWLEKQPHMPQDFEDEFLTPFICGTKSLEIAKQKLESFCTLLYKFPDNFSFKFRDPLDPQFKETSKMGKLFLLPKQTPEGYRVVMGLDYEADKYENFWTSVIMTMSLETIMMLYPDCPGIILLFDCQVSDSRLMTKIGLSTTSFLLQYLQSAMPMKLKRIILYNAPSIFDTFINTFVKPYMKSKLFDRLVMTSKGGESLKEYIPIDILPSDIEGGQAPSTDEINAEWKNLLASRRDYFKKVPSLAIDETKRLPDAAQTYGVDGTFRMLSVD